jgi:hypothetical protein
MRSLFLPIPLALLVACVGDPPPGGGDVDAAPPIDAPDEAGLTVAGRALDYFTAEPLPDVQLASEGMNPEVSATTDGIGNFLLEDVPPGSVFYVSASRTNYRPTRNTEVRVEGEPVTGAEVLAVSVNDSRRQYTTLNLTPTAGRAVLFVNLLKNNGDPLDGIPLADITLVDGQNAPVGVGPFFFGANGDLVSNIELAVSTIFNGKARAGFLDVPPGSYTLKVAYTDGGGLPQTFEVPVTTIADGATLSRTGGMGGMGPMPGQRTFTADVHPRLQRASAGGLGCANCHNAAGVAAVLPFDGTPADVHAAMLLRPGVIAPPQEAETSLLLTKPLYEDPPNHPNATFLTPLDPDYIVIMEWISQGAPI